MNEDVLSVLLRDPDAYYREAFQRNLGLLTGAEQDRLRRSTVAIAGVGGVGGYHLVNLVRLGVGSFRIADLDCFEAANIQRQCGVSLDTLGKPKAPTMEKIALAINPHLKIRTFAEGVHPGNVNEFLAGSDVLLDGIDFFAVSERRLLFRVAREQGIPAVTAGPLGFGSALLVFTPGGMSFDEYFDLREGMDYLDQIIAFGVGLAPAALHLRYLGLGSVNLESRSGPSLVSACTLASSLAVTETVAILLQRRPPAAAPHYFQFDPYLRRCRRGYLWRGNRHPLQLLKRRYFRKIFSAREDRTR